MIVGEPVGVEDDVLTVKVLVKVGLLEDGTVDPDLRSAIVECRQTQAWASGLPSARSTSAARIERFVRPLRSRRQNRSTGEHFP